MFASASAAFMLILCLVFMVRLAAGAKRRMAFDAWGRRLWHRVRHLGSGLARKRGTQKSAAQLAEEAIRRARGEGHWEGNVYKPKSFKRPPRDKMH